MSKKLSQNIFKLCKKIVIFLCCCPIPIHPATAALVPLVAAAGRRPEPWWPSVSCTGTGTLACGHGKPAGKRQKRGKGRSHAFPGDWGNTL